jgi:hypothetical protein
MDEDLQDFNKASEGATPLNKASGRTGGQLAQQGTGRSPVL